MKETEYSREQGKIIDQILEVAKHLYTEKHKGNNIELTKDTLKILVKKLW